MDLSFLSYALLLEIILLLVIWIIFLHWRLSKKKKDPLSSDDTTVAEPYEIYLQFIGRELSEIAAHLDELAENQSDDLETINMYQYRLKHLDAEQKTMAEAKGDSERFWELYRSNIEFVYQQQEQPVEIIPEYVEVPVAEDTDVDTRDMAEQLKHFKINSSSLLEQHDTVLELLKMYSEKNESAELSHMLILITAEKEQFVSRLQQMEDEYLNMMNNLAE